MRNRWVSVLSTAVVAASILIAPAAGQARAQSHAASQVKLKDHCVVKHLPGNLELTLCYPT